jgi:hypothetical protein
LIPVEFAHCEHGLKFGTGVGGEIGLRKDDRDRLAMPEQAALLHCGMRDIPNVTSAEDRAEEDEQLGAATASRSQTTEQVNDRH